MGGRFDNKNYVALNNRTSEIGLEELKKEMRRKSEQNGSTLRRKYSEKFPMLKMAKELLGTYISFLVLYYTSSFLVSGLPLTVRYKQPLIGGWLGWLSI